MKGIDTMTTKYSDIRKAVSVLAPDGGFTLKRFNFIKRKTGYQVATQGVEVDTVDEVMTAIENYNGDCGVWLSPLTNKYCVDLSHREKTKTKAMAIGRECHQEKILRWRDMECLDVI